MCIHYLATWCVVGFHDRRHQESHDEVYHARMRKRTRRFFGSRALGQVKLVTATISPTGSQRRALGHAMQLSDHLEWETHARSSWQMFDTRPSYGSWSSRKWQLWWPPIQGLPGRGPALVNLPVETELSHGGMCYLLCPNVGSLVSCVEHPAIAPWVSTLSGWQMTILRTCVVSVTYTSYMVSKQWRAWCESVFLRWSHWEVAWTHGSLSYAGVSAPPVYSHVGHCDALGFFFPPFKREMSAGRIKIGRLGMISLYAHPPASCDTFCFEVFSIVSLFHEFWLRDFLPRLLFWKEVGPFLSHGA